MSIFKKNEKLTAAKEQRKIDKLKNKSEKERIKNENHRKNGGAGITASVIYADVNMPESRRPEISAKHVKSKKPSAVLNGKKKR